MAQLGSDEDEDLSPAATSEGGSEDGGDGGSSRRCPDSWALPASLKRPESWRRPLCWREEVLPVEGAWRYTLKVAPVPLPSAGLKLLALPVYWAVCLAVHGLQRRLQRKWDAPGEDGQVTALERWLPGTWQVGINVAVVIAASVYAIMAYAFHLWFLEMVLNPVFTARRGKHQVCVAVLMYTIAVLSACYVTQNWVVGTCGLLLFFSYAVVGRTVQEYSTSRGQIGLGPSRSPQDIGASFSYAGPCSRRGAAPASAPDGGSPAAEVAEEAGAHHPTEKEGVRASLLLGDAGPAAGAGGDDSQERRRALRFALPERSPLVPGDDAVIVEQALDGAFRYHAPCGRANIFRLDCALVLALAAAWRLPSCLIGAGSYNQCAGAPELAAAAVYIPVGYTAFAAFGFRLGLATRSSMAALALYTLWPALGLALGGFGCGTLTELLTRQTLPQIWSTQATFVEFGRGARSCAEPAYHLGGETLLVASTALAAWAHILSNFALLFGFVSGAVRGRWGQRARAEQFCIV